MPPNKWAKYTAEALGTFFMVWAGTSAIVVNEISGGNITHLGVSLVFGLIVLAVIYSIGHISGAHINPAVSLGFWAAGRIKINQLPYYIGAQLLGAVLASILVQISFWGHVSPLGGTLPQGSLWQSAVFEFVMTFVLMFVIMGVAHDERAEGLMAGVAIGATIALLAILGGPVSGASMNPARSFGPAMITGIFKHHWIYWVFPLLGASAGARTYLWIRCGQAKGSIEGGCC